MSFVCFFLLSFYCSYCSLTSPLIVTIHTVVITLVRNRSLSSCAFNSNILLCLSHTLTLTARGQNWSTFQTCGKCLDVAFVLFYSNILNFSVLAHVTCTFSLSLPTLWCHNTNGCDACILKICVWNSSQSTTRYTFAKL